MPRKRRGRRRGKRRIGQVPQNRCFSASQADEEEVVLKVEEVETLRLVDLENLNQEEAASKMGVSRKTLWNDLKSARKKVAKALTEGKTIRIEGGNYFLGEEE
ncbi:MAG: DUF134 domain-containing protein [Candidatus Thermoplasmatota archaeon]|nr:DUF134 domain-containing protein [Candidatus Thermoplasmatota archaeon]